MYKIPEHYGMMLHSTDKPDTVDTVLVELRQIKPPPKNIIINRPEDVFTLLQEMQYYDRERMKVIHMDIKNHVLNIENISTGTIGASVVHPREFFKGAILSNSAGMIAVHNHPSGDPVPSDADRNVDLKLTHLSEQIGIPLLDFIVIGKGKFYSRGKGEVVTMPSHQHLT